jgi:hypothetical protein
MLICTQHRPDLLLHMFVFKSYIETDVRLPSNALHELIILKVTKLLFLNVHFHSKCRKAILELQLE